mmetsp:Transcript_59899/g.185657  ORF Transcript_59899/g.185657 Transcript_59899/m.185657 type:complete len:333 (+) Transcript_59899:1671-2669(+)
MSHSFGRRWLLLRCRLAVAGSAGTASAAAPAAGSPCCSCSKRGCTATVMACVTAASHTSGSPATAGACPEAPKLPLTSACCCDAVTRKDSAAEASARSSADMRSTAPSAMRRWPVSSPSARAAARLAARSSARSSHCASVAAVLRDLVPRCAPGPSSPAPCTPCPASRDSNSAMCANISAASCRKCASTSCNRSISKSRMRQAPSNSLAGTPRLVARGRSLRMSTRQWFSTASANWRCTRLLSSLSCSLGKPLQRAASLAAATCCRWREAWRSRGTSNCQAPSFGLEPNLPLARLRLAGAERGAPGPQGPGPSRLKTCLGRTKRPCAGLQSK